MYSVALFETMTGDLALPLPGEVIAGGSFLSKLETGGTVKVAINAADTQSGIDGALLRALTNPTGQFSAAVLWDGGMVAAGVVLDSSYDRDAGGLSVGCKDLGDTFWPARLTFGVNNKTAGSLTVSNRTYEGAVRAVLQRAMQWGATWPLPVDLPPDNPGTFSAVWDWWEVRNIQELLDQIRKEGIEIHHTPYVDGAGRLRHSTTVSSQTTTNTVMLSASASGSPVTGLKYRRDGSRIVTGVFLAGNGKGTDALSAWQGTPLPNIPVRDSYSASSEVTQVARLQRMANADHAANAAPVAEWGLTVQLGDGLSPAGLLPGARLNLDVRGDAVIPDALHALRVLSLSGDLSSWSVTPEVVPYGA